MYIILLSTAGGWYYWMQLKAICDAIHRANAINLVSGLWCAVDFQPQLWCDVCVCVCVCVFNSLCACFQAPVQAAKKGVDTRDIISIDDLKAFKKLIKERTNVLALFGKNGENWTTPTHTPTHTATCSVYPALVLIFPMKQTYQVEKLIEEKYLFDLKSLFGMPYGRLRISILHQETRLGIGSWRWLFRRFNQYWDSSKFRVTEHSRARQCNKKMKKSWFTNPRLC